MSTQSIQQYIDLYRAHREAFDNGTPRQLVERREAALAVLNAGGVSADLSQLLAPDYGINVNRLDIEANVAASFRCDVPNLSTALHYVAVDVLHAGPTARPVEGVTVMSLRRAAAEHPQWLEALCTIADINDPVVALNTLLAQDGVLVHVAKGVRASKPIQLVNVFASTAPLMAARRLLVVAEPDSHVQLLTCDHTQRDDLAYLSLAVNEIVLGEGAAVELYDLEESTPLTTRLSSTRVSQAAGSNVLIDTITLSGGNTRNAITVDVNGEHAETTLLGMAVAGGSERVSNHTVIAHHAPRCVSNEMYKYILNDEARATFGGLIRVDADCPRVEAYQGNRNLLASATARVHSDPQLEIYTDDVRCSHGSATGQLDENALFYMRSRGIPFEVARTMLMQAFMADVIDGVRLETLRDRLRHLVEKRLAGQLAGCAGCDACS